MLKQQRWTGAAICLGLLASARTPLLAMAPVFFLHLHVRNALTAGRCLAFAAALLLPYVPFLIVDPAAVKDGMFDTYVRVMKNFVWKSTTWAADTYGITGRLLERGQQRYVEIVQLLSLTSLYVVSWRSMRKGSRVEPWLAFSLLLFAMTTLWSVLYLYYDVWLLLTCALIVEDGSLEVLSPRRPNRIVGLAFAMATLVVLTSAAVRPGASLKIDVGEAAAGGYTGGGFGRDVSEVDETRSVVWIDGPTARLRLPRAGWTGGTIRLAIRPNVPHPGAHQTVIASLNGHALGGRALDPGWQEITFKPSRRDWLYGFNVIDLHFSYAGPRQQVTGAGRTTNSSAAVDYVIVE
jgi:hypothetical protein